VPSWLRVSLIESANPAQLVARHFRISEAGMGWAVGSVNPTRKPWKCAKTFSTEIRNCEPGESGVNRSSISCPHHPSSATNFTTIVVKFVAAARVGRVDHDKSPPRSPNCRRCETCWERGALPVELTRLRERGPEGKRRVFLY